MKSLRARAPRRSIIGTAGLVLTSAAAILSFSSTTQTTPALYYPAPGDRWERKTPDQVGMDPKILAEAMAFAPTIETTDSK
ncbi:MAG TPA: hypothetical protein VFV34_15060, partial [Blastocatellia bacterium]|nr:hypothetical protein [Blastocatellia bacterium]